MKIISIANHKGGVGKTALTLNLAYLLSAEFDQHVLMIDLDPQSSLTEAMIGNDEERNIAKVMGGGEVGTIGLADILEAVTPTLHLAPCDIMLADNQLGMVQRRNRERILANALRTVADQFTVCIIDCAPALSLPTVNALVASDGVIIPTRPAAVDLRGTALFLKSIEDIKDDLNPNLHVLGIVPTFLESRTNYHQSALEDMAGSGLAVWEGVGKTIRIQESMTEGVPLALHDARNKQNAPYRAIAQRVNQWLENQAN